MTPPELPSATQGVVPPHPRRPFAPHDAAGWAGYFLTVFSLLLPGYLFVLLQLRWYIHDYSITGFVMLLLVLGTAFTTAFVYTWGLTRHFPVRGGVAFLVSLLLLLQVAHFISATP